MVLREARRFFKSSPLLSLSGAVVLALGIGASALTLALLMAFSSLAYPAMKAVGYATVAEETEGGGSIQITWSRFEALRASSSQVTTLAAYSKQIDTTLGVNDEKRPLRVAAISTGFFSAFSRRLTTGRDFSQEEETQAGKHVAILSHSLAANLFRSPQNALGQFLEIDGLSYEVVGVAPPRFHGVFGDSVGAWVPAHCLIPLVLKTPPGHLADPDVWKYIAAFYGLAASDRVSSTELAAILARSLPLRGVSKAPLHVSQGLTTDPVRDTKLRKWLRLGLLLSLLFTIVSGLNYSLLLLARTPRHAEEVHLKRALGAGSGRLMTELMIGPTALVGTGLVAASLFCAGGLMLVSRVSEFYGQLVRGSWQVAFQALGVQVPLACALTLVIALIPALSLLRDDGAPQLAHTSTATRRTGFSLQILVTIQMAFCIGTWILAGMIVSSVTSLMRENLGYDPSHLTVVSMGPASGTITFTAGSSDTFPTRSAIGSLIEQLTAIPGVQSVSFADSVPFGSPMATLEIQRLDGASATPRTVAYAAGSPGYFRTMGSRLLRGRDFSWDDSAASENKAVIEVVINESLARELWPKGDPVGRSVRLIHPEFAGMPSFSSAAMIVGIVEDMRFSGFTESPGPTVFSSLAGGYVTPYLVVNGLESIHSVQDVASRQVGALMPGLSVLDIYSVSDRTRASLLQEKERAYFALAGALAMGLVAYIGLYGALAFYVNTRRRELAVRLCLGAAPWGIRKIILARAAQCAVLAAALSLPLWPMLARLSSSEYLGRVSWSTEHAVLISLACVSVSVFISLVPATAATRVSPAEVLKDQ
jgi:putative ABC transport system permease protein